MIGLAIVVGSGPLLAAAGPNPGFPSLAVNSGFEEMASAQNVRGWSFDSWQKKPAASLGEVDREVFHGGRQSIRLTNLEGDDSRFIQYLTVKPGTWYRVGVWIKTQGLREDVTGAGISVMDVQASVRDLRGNRDWTWVEVFGRTGENQKELPLALRLGYYGNNATGTAWFDDLQVEEVTGAPNGATILPLYQTPPAAGPTQGAAGFPPVDLFLVGIGLVLGFLALAWGLSRRPPGAELQKGPVLLWLTLGATVLFLSKLLLAAFSRGYPADIGTFSSWALEVFRVGPADFYRPGYFADYPPAYFYVLWLIGAFANLFHLGVDSPVFLAVLKLPALLADIAGGWILYRMVKGQGGPATHPWFALAPLLWLLSPLASFNSAVWGQVDSVFSLALLAAFWLLEGRKLKWAGALFAVAVLLKPQALLVAPLALLWLGVEIAGFIKDRQFRGRVIFGPLAAFLATALLLVLPFSFNKSPDWIIQLYANTFGSYDYASLNAANVWYLLGLNWAANSVTFFGLTLSAWGWIGSLAGVVYLSVCLVIFQTKHRSAGGWMFGAFAVFVIFFAVATKMHERYLFPAALLGFGAFQLLRDRRIFWAAIAAACIGFLNILVTLEMFLATGSALIPSFHPLMVIASVAMVGLLVWTLYLCYDIFVRGRLLLAPEPAVRPDKAFAQSLPVPAGVPSLPGVLGRRRAFAAVSALTLIYAVVALADLGSHSSPQSFWEPRNVGESVTLDLGKPADIAAVQYHNGLGSGEYSLEYSIDGLNWSLGSPIVNANPFAEMRWRTVQDHHTARYVRISLVRGRQQLNELIFRAGDGVAFPVPQGGSATPLFDEQATAVAVSDYTNGMYFDEVYFARSAWEILQGRNASENTHPPLGKIIVAGSVAFLGMNPFAYRLPGALFGVAMIPLMYLLALRLVRQRRWAFLAAWLLAVDFMHFTQTRLATVDTFVLLFVLSASYWLIRWRQDSAEGAARLNPLWCLVFSGLSIGMGMATKWTAVYAAIGLAVLFFVGFFRLGGKWMAREGLRTILTCLLAFVMIPVLIYVCAYLPLMAVTGSGLEGVLGNQSSMWSYHSQMKDSHPFSSQWYQWPLMVKPMWLYSGSAHVAPDLASTIIAFGNPVVWYLGSAAFLFLAASLSAGFLRRLLRGEAGLSRFDRQTGLTIVLLGLAQYLPWAVIPRKLVFIYHFFLTVPFILLALVFVCRQLAETSRTRWVAGHLWWIVGAAATVLFIVYFPVLGGTPFPRWWAEGLRFLGIPIYF